MGYDAWLESGWNILPTFRNDIRAQQKHPLNIQWIDNKDSVVRLLNASNWQQANNTSKKYSNWFKNTSNPSDLPVVKHIHNGQYNTLTFVKSMTENRLAIIRLWPSAYFIQSKNSKAQLWIGEIALSKITAAPFLSYLTTVNDFKNTLKLLTADLSATYEIRKKAFISESKVKWDGEVVLVKQ